MKNAKRGQMNVGGILISVFVAAMILVALAIGLAMGGQTLSTVASTQTANSAAANITNQGLTGLQNVSTWQPTWGTLVAAVAVIGILFAGFITYFSRK